MRGAHLAVELERPLQLLVGLGAPTFGHELLCCLETGLGLVGPRADALQEPRGSDEVALGVGMGDVRPRRLAVAGEGVDELVCEAKPKSRRARTPAG